MSNPLAGKHTCTYRGKRVRIHCRDGSVLSGRFVARTRNKRLILDTGTVEMLIAKREGREPDLDVYNMLDPARYAQDD